MGIHDLLILFRMSICFEESNMIIMQSSLVINVCMNYFKFLFRYYKNIPNVPFEIKVNFIYIIKTLHIIFKII